MVLKSFSKINLSLSINKKLKNGLHDIQSYFCLVNLFDQIKIKKISGRKDIVKFTGKFARLVDNDENSILDTLKILREQKVISNSYLVSIHKKIPVFAGLGGGTSNAAYLIKYLTKNRFKQKLLDIMSKKIGSDLKLFFHNQGFLKNFKTINDLKKNYKLPFLLIYPNIKCSTRFIYSKVKKYSTRSKYSFNKINSKQKFMKVLKNSNNDLQLIVENKYSIIKKLLIEIKAKEGCVFSRMTGSGSVCYGVFTSEKTAKAALIKIKSKYPRFWFSVTKTI